MALNQKTFHCSVITPGEVVLECEATFVAFPAHDGEIGILYNRAPLVCKMGKGDVRIHQNGEPQRIGVNGGFAQVLNNRLTILTARAG